MTFRTPFRLTPVTAKWPDALASHQLRWVECPECGNTDIGRDDEIPAQLTLECDRLRDLLPDDGSVYVVVAEALLPELAEWSEPVQMRVERREGQRIDLVFRRLDAALRETEG